MSLKKILADLNVHVELVKDYLIIKKSGDDSIPFLPMPQLKPLLLPGLKMSVGTHVLWTASYFHYY